MDGFCWKLESLERDTSNVARVDSSTNSQRHCEKLLYGDYYLNILANPQEYLIQHDYQSLYPNSYHMNWNSTNLYYMICSYTICRFKFCINTILSSIICIYTICIYTICIYKICNNVIWNCTICIYTICYYTTCIYTICIYTVCI
jgi:hypothetical protein